MTVDSCTAVFAGGAPVLDVAEGGYSHGGGQPLIDITEP
jgi:hypothetical protein